MDHRRPIRPPHPAGAPRRPLFTTSSTGASHPSRANSRTTAASKPAAVHIPPDDPNNRDDDLVERDAAGNYKIMAPSTAMKMAVEVPISPEQEEKEQDDRIIALYGKSSCHWDQAGMLPLFLLPLDGCGLHEGLYRKEWGHSEERRRSTV
jgi:hypothetical protein